MAGEPSAPGGAHPAREASDGMFFACHPRSPRLPSPTAAAPPARAEYSGGVAQLGERVNGIHEVRGWIPLAPIPAGGAAAGASECSCAGRAEYIGSEPARL